MRKKDLYLPNGFLNVPYFFKNGTPFVSIVGGRGIGKTYGALEYVIENKIKFLYLRRLQTQIDAIKNPKYNPMKKLNTDHSWSIYPFPLTKNTFGFFHAIENDGGKLTPLEGKFYGYGISLSTFANYRGLDASDVDAIIYDEFIPELNQPYMKGEAEAFFNLCETVFRNRELEGKEPGKVFFFSNSTDAANPIYLELGIVMDVMKMQAKGIDFREYKERALTIVLPHDSPISEAKAETSLYRLTKGTNFAKSSLGNEFVNNVPTSVKSRPISEYKPLVKAGEICIYEHKSNGRYYVSGHASGTPEIYGTSEKELSIFRRRWPELLKAVYLKNIDYESYACEILFDKYMNQCYI